MDGLARTSGEGYILVKVPKSYQGAGAPNGNADGFDEYKWPPMRLSEFSVIENHLLKERVSPVEAVLPELKALYADGSKAARKLARTLEQNAYDDLRKNRATNRLTIEQVQAWIDSVDGMLFSMKICLQRFHPDLTDKEVQRIFDWLGEDEARRLRDLSQGSDAVGNSTGPTAAGAAGATNAGPLAPSPGGESTGISPSSSDGRPASSTN